MAEIPPGKTIPDADRKRAELFFDKAQAIADTQNYEYAIELYLQGLNFDPESVEKHHAIRELSLIRKSKGGKPLGMFQQPKATKDDKQNMLNAEKVLAYDPGNLDAMEKFLVAAQKAGCYDTVSWIGKHYMHANINAKQPSFQRYMKMKDVYFACGKFKEALDAMTLAVQLKPNDMDLDQELKNLSAEHTIQKAKYDQVNANFMGSVKDADTQRKLMMQDMDIRSVDNMVRAAMEAEQAYAADPADVGKFNRYIEALRKTEQIEYENRAIELLTQKFQETRAYKFKAAINQITLAQYGRQERSEREEYNKAPADPAVKKRYTAFVKEKTELELQIFRETVENYPTDTVARFEMGVRLFRLARWEEAIGILQDARNDPKYKVQATILLGRAFFHAGFVDEAVDTLQEAIQTYPVRGDEKSIEIHYYCALALETKGDTQAAIKMYSQVAQWKFAYRDVQQRIKRLRGLGGAGGQPAGGGEQPPQNPPTHVEPTGVA